MEPVAATPAAEAAAAGAGVDVAQIEGTGADGRVVVADVKEHVEADPYAHPFDVDNLTYAKQPESPEEQARRAEILHAFEMSQAANPLPLEWLVESLKRLVHLHPPKAV